MSWFTFRKFWTSISCFWTTNIWSY